MTACRSKSANLGEVFRLDVRALTNEDFRHFNMAMRIPVDLNTLPFVVMKELFEVGDAYVEEVNRLKEATKAEAKQPGLQGVRRKTPAHKKLGATNPW